MARVVRMRWPELGLTAGFELEDQRNRELCDEFWNELPFMNSVQEHGTVTGELIYTWVPMISLAPVKFFQQHTDAPEGRVTYSQGTGNKVIIKYGPLSEDISVPALGLVRQEDLPVIREVGKAIWASYLGDKEIYHVRFEREETR